MKKTNEIVSVFSFPSLNFSWFRYLIVLIQPQKLMPLFLVSLQCRRCLKKAIEITECLEAQNVNVLLLGNTFKVQRVVFISLDS